MPDRVRQSMDISNEDHRAPGMEKLWHPLIDDLKKVFETTTAQPFIFPGTGSSGWEAALTNLLNKGDKVLSARFGQFSHLWIEMCKKLHIDVEANTIAGLVIHEAQTIPVIGQVFSFHGFRFQVSGRIANRITEVKIRPL